MPNFNSFELFLKTFENEKMLLKQIISVKNELRDFIWDY